jgi:D-alanyl-D-alanine carboxypeptidase/D-alanyl-D-alanine-endopeptidase (penicillin-binding protein 4)
MTLKLIFRITISTLLISCTAGKQFSKSVQTDLVRDSSLINAHIGISIYDPSEKKYLYDYQGDKYFVPASNNKILACYAAMKYLGDSIPGIHYFENDTAVFLIPTGDPSLLHSDFASQPVIDFLKKQKKPLYITDRNWRDGELGSGWSWDDYNANYMVERSPLPIYGNIIKWVQEKDDKPKPANSEFDQSVSIYSIPEVDWKVRFNTDPERKTFYVQRMRAENVYQITQGTEKRKEQEVPFVTNGLQSALQLLPDTIGKTISLLPADRRMNFTEGLKTIYSRPTDSILMPMMHRSDNFFAEQMVLMVSNEKLGVMSNRRIADTMFKTDFKDLPQRPRWADGSGLSRFDLYTPQDFIAILMKMEQEFGMDRIKRVFATGGTGTLASFYKQDSGYIFAKTGTLSGVVALSGFLYTKKNKLLIFSVLVNNHQSNATTIRRKVEAVLTAVRQQY